MPMLRVFQVISDCKSAFCSLNRLLSFVQVKISPKDKYMNKHTMTKQFNEKQAFQGGGKIYEAMISYLIWLEFGNGWQFVLGVLENERWQRQTDSHNQHHNNNKKTTLLRNVLPYFVPHFSPALHKRFYYTSYLLSVEGGLKRCLIFPQKLLMRNKKNKFPLLQCCFLFGLDLVVKGANFTFPWCAWKGKMTKASSRVWLW